MVEKSTSRPLYKRWRGRREKTLGWRSRTRTALADVEAAKEEARGAKRRRRELAAILGATSQTKPRLSLAETHGFTYRANAVYYCTTDSVRLQPHKHGLVRCPKCRATYADDCGAIEAQGHKRKD